MSASSSFDGLDQETAERLETLWQAGMTAYVRGYPRANCPHPYQSIEGVYWEWGWDWCARDDDQLSACPYVHPDLAQWWQKTVRQGGTDRPPFPLDPAVDCPAVGDMPKHKCLEHQGRPRGMAFVNPYFSKLYRACRSGCPHSKLAQEY